MTIQANEIDKTIFRCAKHTKLSEFAHDLKTFNVLGAIDGKRTVEKIANEGHFDPLFLAEKVKLLYAQGLIEKVEADGMTRGQAKKILDAIIKKRSRGVRILAKTIKIKLTLKGINPDKLTPDTPDDPALLKKLTQMAKSYGVQTEFAPDRVKQVSQTWGKTKLMLDSIITQRSGGDPQMAKAIKTKFKIVGVNADAYSLDTPDDPNLVKKLNDLASKLGIIIPMVSANVDAQIEQFFKA